MKETTSRFRTLRFMAGYKPRLVALIVLTVLAGGTLALKKAGAQSGQGPQPGAQDPVGRPADYTILASHNLAVFFPFVTPPVGPGTLGYRTYDSDGGLRLTQTAEVKDTLDTDQYKAAAGRIWSPKNEQVIYIRRYGGTTINAVFAGGVGAPQPVFSYEIDNFAPRLPYSADFMDLAVGDLDKRPDTAGDNHDEVVIAYASPAANGQLSVNVTVLDYTAPASTPAPPQALAATSATASRSINTNSFSTTEPIPAIMAVDNVLAVALGDFDNDKQNEIAVVHLQDAQTVWLTTFRYTNDGRGARSLREVSALSFKPYGDAYCCNSFAAGAVDIVAGDFDGKGGTELLVSNSFWQAQGAITPQYFQLSLFQADAQLRWQPRLNTAFVNHYLTDGASVQSFADLGSRSRLEMAAGVFKYDPANGFDLHRRQVALAWNTPVLTNGSQGLCLQVVAISDDLSSLQPLGGANKGLYWKNPSFGSINQRFSLAAGAYRGNSGSPPPLWGLALGTWHVVSANSSNYVISMVNVGNSDPSFANQTNLGGAGVQSAARYSLVAADLEGKAIHLGAPVHFIISGTVNPDFILHEPPKHTFYDNREGSPTRGQVVTVSRYDAMNVELKTSKGETFSGKSTDTAALTAGGSVALSATFTAEGNAIIAKTKNSQEFDAKISYDYNQKKESYNSNYSSRTITQVEKTDHDDKLLGRLQTFDVWRYRIYGVTATDPDGAPVNAFYEVTLPGPTIDFNGGGLNFDWYQPFHENGNILSYPQAFASKFTPDDLGTFKVPCPASPPKGETCNSDGTLTKSEPLIPAALNFFDGTSGSLAYDYANSTGTGNSVSYSHTFAASAEMKISQQAEVDDFFTDGREQISVDVELHANGSWGGSKTSDTTTTSETGITLNRPSGDATQAYAFYPVFYATKEGVIKVTHAVDPLGSASGRAFWAGFYGRKADPALNLPQRFIPNYTFNVLVGWEENKALTRKQLRGFFLRKPEINPVTKDYDYLASAPLAGEKVRIDARVYNYSTAVAANNLVARFQAVAYDAASDREIDPTTGQPVDGQVEASRRVTIGETIIPLLTPQQQETASIVWDTKAIAPPLFNNVPAGGSQAYRIYVVLDPGNTIDETYETEMAGVVDPGQNNEGFGLATFKHPSLGAAVGVGKSNVYLKELSLAGLDAPFNRNDPPQLKADQVRAFLGRPLRLRVATHSDQNHRALDHLLIYDGDPDKGGKLIASKIVHTGDTRGSYVWFEWTPLALGQHTLFARVLERSGDTKPGDNVDTLTVNVVPFDTVAPGIEVTLTPRELWPADGRMARVSANIRVRDDLDPNPVVKLEAITSSETRLGAIDIGEALFGTDDRQFLLRAQNLTATGPGRVYTVTYSVTDWAGNQTRYATTIRVRR